MEDKDRETELEARVMRPLPEKTIRGRSSSPNDLDSNWLITLSDVLSLLLVFFVVFTIMAKSTRAAAPKDHALKAEAAATAGPAPAPGDAALFQKSMVDEMNIAIKQLAMENDVSVHAVDKEIIITLKEKVAFRPGEAEPLGSSEPILDNIAHIIQEHPLFLVDIEGHTDNIPIRTRHYPSNWELSVARATNVLKYFIKRHGVDPTRLSIKGNADQKPLVGNDTPDNRARNRRVEIRLKEREG
jgi:chemotaxis protein MotB